MRKNIFYKATRDRWGNVNVVYIDAYNGYYKNASFVWYTIKEIIQKCRKDYNINMTREACKSMYTMNQNKQLQISY